MHGQIIINCLLFFFIILVILIIIVAIRSYVFKPKSEDTISDYKPSLDLETAKKLSEAIRLKTISHMNSADTDWKEFEQFQLFLKQQFPQVHSVCTRTVINSYSLSYHWKGRSKDPSLKPILITAHMDVVPVEEDTTDDWLYPAFEGAMKEGYVWGRGTLDIKIHLITALEAVERLIKEGFVPARDVYLAFGHDEELDGMQGAYKIAEYYEKQGLQFEFVLDEGGFVSNNILAGIDKPIGLVGIGEKGFANIKLSVTSDGGHSSMPSKHSSLGILAQALCRLEKHSCRLKLIPPVRQFLKSVGLHMKGINHVILTNLWLFQPLFMKVFSATNTGGALVKTTIAVTMAQGSPAPNIVPQKSSAVINCRILPGETGEDLMKFLSKCLKGLPVKLKPLVLDDPSKISPTDTQSYQKLSSLIRKYCDNAIVLPYLVMASTDARKYESVCDNIYRFTPYIIDAEDTEKIHGTNERISIENINRCVDFFRELISSYE